ncbi:DMT family transporter [Ornithinimicrobium murale]|uniref:DMT family transporter n=1 Tax=Ornithinimicrobium murale TaxID=1050153 RepID=UPI000E0CE93D|nr:DMT family transporter [Ornithinimicrobium murale]
MTTAPARPEPVGDCPPAPTATSAATATDPSVRTSRPGVLAAVAVVATMVMWASAFVAIRHIGPDLSPGPLALIRVVIATLVILPLAVRAGLQVPRGRAWWVVGSYAILWMALYSVVINSAEHHLDAGTTAMLVNVAPILVTLWVGLVQRAGFTRPLVGGLVVAFTGVSVIALGNDGAQRSLIGIALGLLAAILFATGILLQKHLLRSMDALSVTWWGMALGAVALLPFVPTALAEAGSAPASALLSALYLGIFPTALAFTLWAYALRRVEAARLSLSSYLVPAFAVLLSWVLLAEVPTAAGLVGGTLCLAGVAISRIRTRG